jgi:hypothetical protein
VGLAGGGGRVRGVFGRLWRRLGRRGCALLFFSMLDWVFAFSLLAPAGEAKRSEALMFVGHLAPLQVWAAVWAVPAVLCMWKAWVRHDQAAFAAAIAVKVLWGLLYLIGWVAAGLDRAYVAIAIWWALAAFVAIISGWPEPAPGGRDRR